MSWFVYLIMVFIGGSNVQLGRPARDGRPLFCLAEFPTGLLTGPVVLPLQLVVVYVAD